MIKNDIQKQYQDLMIELGRVKSQSFKQEKKSNFPTKIILAILFLLLTVWYVS